MAVGMRQAAGSAAPSPALKELSTLMESGATISQIAPPTFGNFLI
jgi:hypothetical protein